MKSAHAISVGGNVWRQNLERHLAMERGIVGKVNLTHSARAETRNNFIPPELFAGTEG